MQFRPRFSVRTLAIVVTLVCAYLACWPPTKKYAVPQIHTIPPVVVNSYIGIPNLTIDIIIDSPLPLVVLRDEIVTSNGKVLSRTKTWHVWLFGPTITVPFTI